MTINRDDVFLNREPRLKSIWKVFFPILILQISFLVKILQISCLFFFHFLKNNFSAPIPKQLSFMKINGLNNGSSIIFWYFAIIWATDCGAYFIGRKIGGRKLAPTISPGKTISGAMGGCLLGFLTGALLSFSVSKTGLSNLGIMGAGIIAIFISILAQAGDLLESWVKRKFGIKDSGNIIPGHGGMMDRMDSITFSAPFLIFVLSRVMF